MSGPIIAVISIVGVVLVLALIAGAGASRYKKCGPNQAMITTGRGGQKVIIGGGLFIWPIVQRLFYLDLEAHKVFVKREGIYSKNRVPIDVESVIVYKVKSDVPSVTAAAQALLTSNVDALDDLIQSVAEGAFRDIIGKMTPEQVNEDREGFQNQVLTIAQGHFDKLGMDLISFVVTHISDKQKYFQSLGAPAIAEVQQNARQKTAIADREARVTEVERKREADVIAANMQAETFAAERDRDVKKAGYDATVYTERAIAEQAGPKATAKAQQGVVEEQTELALKEAERTEKQLISTVVKPAEAARTKMVVEADAGKQKMILEADGNKQSKILEADGEKQRKLLTGEGDGEYLRLTMTKEAEGIKAKLLAQAEGNKAILLADAAGLSAKAEAMKLFTDSTIQLEAIKEYFKQLPAIVAAAASPIGQIKDIKVVHFTGGSGADGKDTSPIASFLNVTPEVLAKADVTLKNTLGYGLNDIIARMAKGTVLGVKTETNPEEDK